MSELAVFENPRFGKVRTVNRGGEPWFVAADVCRVLEIANTSDAIGRLDDDERMTLDSTEGHSGKRGGAQMCNIVSESGLYALILGSRKPEARAFKRWITHEVIPAIRKRGMYATPAAAEAMLNDPDMMIRTLIALKAERKERLALEALAAELTEKAEKDAPKVLFADSVAASSQAILIGELAKLLKQNGYNIGQNRLFARMREEGLLGKYGERRNIPTQRAMEQGLFEIKESCVYNPDGSIRITRTPKVTGKGQLYFVKRYLGGEMRA